MHFFCLFKVSYKGPDRSKRITLWLHDNHYDVIKSLKGFYGQKHYCQACEKPFQRIEDHRCTNACYVCHDISCITDEPVRCHDCNRLCRSEECFHRHKTVSGRQELSFCDRVSNIIFFILFYFSLFMKQKKSIHIVLFIYYFCIVRFTNAAHAAK